MSRKRKPPQLANAAQSQSDIHYRLMLDKLAQRLMRRQEYQAAMLASRNILSRHFMGVYDWALSREVRRGLGQHGPVHVYGRGPRQKHFLQRNH